jgi:hypothetical protein
MLDRSVSKEDTSQLSALFKKESARRFVSFKYGSTVLLRLKGCCSVLASKIFKLIPIFHLTYTIPSGWTLMLHDHVLSVISGNADGQADLSV